jgi:thiol-disulfide isomerase/thioredoxin
MEKVIFYTKENCSLCDDAESLLELFQQDYPFEIVKRDIYTNDAWLEAYHLLIPVVDIKGIQLNCEQMDFGTLEETLKTHLPREARK